MAGVFTLNMKLIQSCICEALGSFIPGFAGFCSLLSPITMLLGSPSVPTTPPSTTPFRISPRVCATGFSTLMSPCREMPGPVNALCILFPTTTVARSGGSFCSYCSCKEEGCENLPGQPFPEVASAAEDTAEEGKQGRTFNFQLQALEAA